MNRDVSKRLFWYRVKLIALVVVFISPFVGGWLALYVFEWRPSPGNYGELIQPVRKLDWPALETLDGHRLESGFGRKWTLLLFAADSCAAQCRNNLFYMRQIRTLLGRDTRRLQNVLVSGQPVSAELREFLQDYPSLVVIENNRDPVFYRQFQLPDQDAVGSSARMYLVDPDHNLMMHYPAENDEKRVLEDLKKLMKLSRIG